MQYQNHAVSISYSIKIMQYQNHALKTIFIKIMDSMSSLNNNQTKLTLQFEHQIKIPSKPQTLAFNISRTESRICMPFFYQKGSIILKYEEENKINQHFSFTDLLVFRKPYSLIIAEKFQSTTCNYVGKPQSFGRDISGMDSRICMPFFSKFVLRNLYYLELEEGWGGNCIKVY